MGLAKWARYLDTVIEFETSVTFSKDKYIKCKNCRI